MTDPATPLTVSVPTREIAEALAPLPDRVEIVEWDLTGPPPRPSFDLVVQPHFTAPDRLRALRDVPVRLVQSLAIGYDGIAEELPPGVAFANASSVHETSTAELALALVLAAQRGIPDFVRAAAEGRWAFGFRPSLADRRVLIVGYGNVGAAIEARLLPFEVEVVRVASRRREEANGHVHGIDELAALLPAADVVIVAVPLTPDTRGLVDAAFLAAMADDALLVNVARGPVADTAAILAEARSGRLRFALDVTDPEPLPPGHPLFDAPNVLISPHVGGSSSAMRPRAIRLIRRQIELLAAGDEPVNVVLRG